MKNYFPLFIFIISIQFISCQKKVTSVLINTITSYQYENYNFEVIAHRGYSDIYPENTLLSIEEAFKRGLKYCEIDVNVTSDDVYVLFHDQPTMYRTSSSKDYVVASTYKELLEFDYGTWKGSQFKNTKIATLEEALLLAEEYDAYLYLDTKKFRPDLMGKALKDTKVNSKRLLSSIANIEEAKKFKKECPNSPFVYFGGLPENPDEDKFYKDLVDLGCVVFETYYRYVLEKDNKKFKKFVKKVHEHNAKVWVFTSNTLKEIIEIRNKNVDGVESDIAPSLMEVLYNQEKRTTILKATTGNWSFENKNLESTGIGSQFRYLNYQNKDAIQPIKFGTTSSFGIHSIKNKDVHVIKVPAFNPKNGLFLFTNFTPGINENLHQNYSLLLDIYIPKESENKTISLFQTNSENENDGDFFINSKGIGINNVYHNPLKSETWYRLGIVVSEKKIKKYVNGILVGENSISGGRWKVYNVFSGGQNQGFLLFADDNNETSELYVSAVQLRNYSMNDLEMDRLGGAKSDGIPISNSGIYALKFEGELRESIVNWERKEIYVTFPLKADISSVLILFKIPFRAISNIKTGTKLDLRDDQRQEILIVAQDGVSKTTWTIIPSFEK